MIRVLVVEDSSVEAQIISEILNSDSQINVVGRAKDGYEAIREAAKLKPSLITMDIHMPGMDGLEATKQIMAYSPAPILILSCSVMTQGADKTLMEKAFKALSYGALDVMEKSFFIGESVDERTRLELIEKVKMLSRIRVIPHPLAKLERDRRSSDVHKEIVSDVLALKKAVGIVASTGGPPALLEIIKTLPSGFGAPVFVVQHISHGFTEGFVQWLAEQSLVRVKVAEQHESIKASTVYVAPTHQHMRVNSRHKIELSDEPALEGQKPSGTLLLQSISDVYGEEGIGVILTGMGRDGADGLKALHEANGYTLAQDEATCVVYGMPKAAADMGVVHEVLPLQKIADRIIHLCVSG